MTSEGDILSHLAVLIPIRVTRRSCADLETGVSTASDGLLTLPKAVVACIIKVISVLVPGCMTGRFIATSSKKAAGEAEGLLEEILISQVPTFQVIFTKELSN